MFSFLFTIFTWFSFISSHISGLLLDAWPHVDLLDGTERTEAHSRSEWWSDSDGNVKGASKKGACALVGGRPRLRAVKTRAGELLQRQLGYYAHRTCRVEARGWFITAMWNLASVIFQWKSVFCLSELFAGLHRLFSGTSFVRKSYFWLWIVSISFHSAGNEKSFTKAFFQHYKRDKLWLLQRASACAPASLCGLQEVHPHRDSHKWKQNRCFWQIMKLHSWTTGSIIHPNIQRIQISKTTMWLQRECVSFLCTSTPLPC